MSNTLPKPKWNETKQKNTWWSGTTAVIIQKSSQSLIFDFKDTCTQGVYMPAVLTSLLLRNAALDTLSLLVLCPGNSWALLPFNRLGVGDIMRGSPMAGRGQSLPMNWSSLPQGCSRFNVTMKHIRSSPREVQEQDEPIMEQGVAANPLKK